MPFSPKQPNTYFNEEIFWDVWSFLEWGTFFGSQTSWYLKKNLKILEENLRFRVTTDVPERNFHSAVVQRWKQIWLRLERLLVNYKIEFSVTLLKLKEIGCSTVLTNAVESRLKREPDLFCWSCFKFSRLVSRVAEYKVYLLLNKFTPKLWSQYIK